MHLDMVESPLCTKCALQSLQQSPIFCLNDPKHCPTLSSLAFLSTLRHFPTQMDTIVVKYKYNSALQKWLLGI